MIIVPGDLSDPRIIALLELHVARALATGPPESCHAFDVAGLQVPEVTFWAGWEAAHLAAIGALLELSPTHGEVKSMHTVEEMRGRGFGDAMLNHIVSTARQRGYQRLSLETGAMDYFAPARALYARHGFIECPPFGDYKIDPNCVFMTLALR